MVSQAAWATLSIVGAVLAGWPSGRSATARGIANFLTTATGLHPAFEGVFLDSEAVVLEAAVVPVAKRLQAFLVKAVTDVGK